MRMFYSDLTNTESESIINSLKEFESPKYLEIGVYYGGTFLKILNYLNENKNEYFCCGVDLFEDLIYEQENYQKRFTENFKNSQTHIIFQNNKLNVSNRNDLQNELYKINTEYKFELIKGHSDEIIPTINKKFDVIFIDGNHTYEQTKKDFDLSYKFLSKKNTIFIFHNTLKSEYESLYLDGGPYKLCEELFLNNNLEFIGTFDRTKIFKRL